MKLTIKNLMLLSLAISMLFACKKDDAKPVEKTYRIKQVLNSFADDSKNIKTTYSYNDENLIQLMKYKKDLNGNWIEYYKMEINYANNTATVLEYYNDANGWVISDKTEYKIENELMMEELSYDKSGDTWVESDKWIYQYSDGKIIGWQSYNYLAGNWSENIKAGYLYENNRMIHYAIYKPDLLNSWNVSASTIFSYSGDNMTGWVLYDHVGTTWIKNKKCEFTYVGNQITNSEIYEWNNTDWNQIPLEIAAYSYNDNGYLVTKEDGEGLTINYEYEEGKGNVKFFTSYHEEIIMGAPTIKSKKKHIPYYQRVNM